MSNHLLLQIVPWPFDVGVDDDFLFDLSSMKYSPLNLTVFVISPPSQVCLEPPSWSPEQFHFEELPSGTCPWTTAREAGTSSGWQIFDRMLKKKVNKRGTCSETLLLPADSPKMVTWQSTKTRAKKYDQLTLLGSPPKWAIFSATQWRASAWSRRPALPATWNT